jgi:pyruvate dehydrogenase E1 component alpha subunit
VRRASSKAKAVAKKPPPAEKREEKPAPQARKHAIELLRTMLLIRRFEEKAAELYQAGKVRGFLHLYIGEEAVGTGAMKALRADDNIVATYREHGHALARGMPTGCLMAELYGKANGCSHGRGGSMHFFDAKRRFFGGHAIVGGGLPMAVGLALADKMRGERRITACFFGEGAVAEGEFHESMNLSELWQLPVLFICENNLYAMGTGYARSEAQTDLMMKARAYGVPADSVDGMDVLAVEQATRRAAAAVRSGKGPYLLEFKTYRFRGHSMADPELYRPKDEVEAWREHDPIEGFARDLRARKLLNEGLLADIEGNVALEIDRAVAFAESGPWEPYEDLMKHVTAR